MIIIQNSLPRYIFMVFFYVKLFLNEKFSIFYLLGLFDKILYIIFFNDVIYNSFFFTILDYISK